MKYYKHNFSVLAILIINILLLINCKTSSGEEIGNTISTSTPETKSDVTFWLTNSDKTVLFQKQNLPLNFSIDNQGISTITIDTTQTYQTIDGFGFALTGGSATLLNSLDETPKTQLLKE